MSRPIIALTDTVVWSVDQVGASLGENVMLLGISTGRYYQLDQVSSDIWQRLESPVQVANLCAQLKTDYVGDAQEVERDVLELLDRLAAEELIERVS